MIELTATSEIGVLSTMSFAYFRARLSLSGLVLNRLSLLKACLNSYSNTDMRSASSTVYPLLSTGLFTVSFPFLPLGLNVGITISETKTDFSFAVADQPIIDQLQTTSYAISYLLQGFVTRISSPYRHLVLP